MLGRFHDALDAFRRAEKLSSRPDAEVFHCIGELLLRKANLPTGGEQLPPIAQAVAATPHGDRSAVQLVPLDAIVADTNLAAAKQYFQRAIENDGRQVDSFRKLANIHVRESQLTKAIEMLERSVLYVLFLFM